MTFFVVRLSLIAGLILVIISSLPKTWGEGRTHGRVVVAIVPMVGSGTVDDPRRPLYAPKTKELGQPGSLDFRFVLSDDKRWAIVAFSTGRVSAESMAALDAVERSTEPGVKAFGRGRDKREDVETEARKLKKDFDLDDLLGSVDAKGGK